ncbi:developmentally-regulated protein [Acrasis kona]|uniref:Developmentally-regulated protein n=1 Tax=Acrasis kona TaxID=1008807 RepID=A0AAW2ZDX4_9EUKA
MRTNTISMIQRSVLPPPPPPVKEKTSRGSSSYGTTVSSQPNAYAHDASYISGKHDVSHKPKSPSLWKKFIHFVTCSKFEPETVALIGNKDSR